MMLAWPGVTIFFRINPVKVHRIKNCRQVGRNSVVGILTRSGDRIPVGEKYFATVHTRPEAYPASYTVGTESFEGVKRPGRGANHSPHLAPRLKKE